MARVVDVQPVVPEVPVPAVTRATTGGPGQRDEVMRRIRDEGGLVVHHEYVAEDNPATRYQLTGKILAEFHEGVEIGAQREILERAGVVVKKQYSDPTTAYLLVVTERADGNPIKVANRLEAEDAVEYAEPVLVNRLGARTVALPATRSCASSGTSNSGPDGGT